MAKTKAEPRKAELQDQLSTVFRQVWEHEHSLRIINNLLLSYIGDPELTKLVHSHTRAKKTRKSYVLPLTGKRGPSAGRRHTSTKIANNPGSFA